MQALQIMPMDKLRGLSVEEQDAMAKQTVKVEKAAKDATSNHKSSFTAAGKIVCIIEERLNALKTERKIAANTSLNSYWESITGTKLNNHALSCANAFGTFVRTGLITEHDYDANSANCLELASSISTKVGGMIEHEAIAETAQELKDRTKDEVKNLRAILDRVKEHKPMDADKARKLLKQIAADGHLELALHALGADIAYEKDAEKLERYYSALNLALDNCGTVEQQEAWLNARASVQSAEPQNA
jgi:hypothetical protein